MDKLVKVITHNGYCDVCGDDFEMGIEFKAPFTVDAGAVWLCEKCARAVMQGIDTALADHYHPLAGEEDGQV